MIGDFVALYLEELEFKRAIELNKRFEPYYIPYLVIRILNHYNENTFEAILCRDTQIFDRNKSFTKNNSGSSGIMIDYNNNKGGAFTFDGVRFFKIVNVAYKSDAEGLIIFTFRYVNVPTFSERDTAFMIMPFRFENLNNFYKQSIKDYLENCDLKIKVYRSDDFTGTDIIADTIVEQIKKAEFIICDITNCNKNVFFEIGFAKGINKDIIFLLEQNKPVDFFDVNHIRRIEYNYGRLDDFQKLIKDTIISIRNTRIV